MKPLEMPLRFLAALCVSVLLCACGAPQSAVPPSLPPADTVVASPTTATPIQHVVVVIQENRSFDNLFATYPGADGATSGSCRRFGKPAKSVPLAKVPLLAKDEPPYAFGNFHTEYDGGKMDGFCKNNGSGQKPWNLPYQYVDPNDVKPLWTIAQQYVLADRMFQTQQSGSFTAHQDLIRGDTALDDTESIVDNPSGTPWGCDAPVGTITHIVQSSGSVKTGPFPCFKWRTLRDLLDAKGLSWKYYAPAQPAEGGEIWNAFDAISAVRKGRQWTTNVSSPETNVFKDLNGTLPAVSWIVPDNFNSDHPGNQSDTGPSWVAQIVNAVAASKYWNSTAIVVLWDDWGGWYDHVKPPQLYYDGLGFRVPCLIVSPYAKHGHIAHTQYEYASILRFIEDNWGLPRLGTHDKAAHSIADAFDFTQRARRAAVIPAKYSKAFFERQIPSGLPVDDR